MTSKLIDSCVRLGNGEISHLADVPTFSLEDFRQVILDTVETGGRVASFFGLPISEKELRILALLIVGKGGELLLLSATVGPSYPALTPDCHQLHMFEREIAEQFSVTPQGHPDLKPVRFQRPHQSIGADPWGRDTSQVIEPAVMDFYRVEGDEIHEVAVGPVHAGVIEPGHFRFQCYGEKVFHLEISLGFQHRGVEKSLIDSPDKKRLYQIQTLSGDTTAGHTLAYCQAIEALSGCEV